MDMNISVTALFGSRACAFALAGSLLAACVGGVAAQDKSLTIKLATATLNDAQHEWMKRFAVAIDKNTNGRIKAELYPASQLGTIPRMIEGTQLGSIQMWVGPPEFLVGVDQRFELLSAPGLFQNDQHAIKTIADQEFSKTFLAIGANKGLIGASLFMYGPAAFAMRAPFRTLADFRGKKIRVLASPFQTEQIARLGGTGVPLTLGDVLPALQQGTIDGTFSAVPIFTTLQYEGAAKYMTETGQAYIFSIAMVSKRWFDGLPADLQGLVMAAAKQAGVEATPWSLDFINSQRKLWTDKGGEIILLPAADKAEMMSKLASVGDDIVKTKPELKPLWDQMVATAKRSN
ncbi:MAG TPA: TRAP transporter substrate-binding protein [Xanthobacteraceae bacterium]|nr:TRAP transporter substrate-binding protein [Xanthobacteraceae bacterium]